VSAPRKIPHTRISDGWRSRSVYIADGPAATAVTVFTSPNGTDLVGVIAGEKPEFVCKPRGLPPLYLRLYAGSAAERRAVRAVKDRLVEYSYVLADKKRRGA
jgi:hypothetical protein